MTVNSCLNFFFLQWLFIRSARIYVVRIDGDDEYYGWAILKAVPITGYFGIPFKHWGKGFLLYRGKPLPAKD